MHNNENQSDQHNNNGSHGTPSICVKIEFTVQRHHDGRSESQNDSNNFSFLQRHICGTFTSLLMNNKYEFKARIYEKRKWIHQ